MSIDELKGMTDVIEATLRARGIVTSAELLKQAATSADRSRLAREVGIEEATLQNWANCADLARIKGVAGIYAELLERAGVDNVRQLAAQDPVGLHQLVCKANRQFALARRSPARSLVEGWVEHARQLPQLLND